jgi:RNA polymerase sigma-70 factor (ECF subfamily)
MLNPAAADTLTDAPADAPAALWARRAFEKQLLNIIPDMRAFARFLVRNHTDADDLVQDAVIRALRSYRQFDLGTNMKAWAFTILRNTRFNDLRKRRFDGDDELDLALRPTPANQLHRVELTEVLAVLATLKPVHREVLTLIRASGLSYEEAAQVMNCKLGTIKSRLNRADAALRDALGADFPPTPAHHGAGTWPLGLTPSSPAAPSAR